MRLLLSAALAVIGALLTTFAAHVLVFGAEPPPPSGSEAIEGIVAEGRTIEGPIGTPFLYGQVKLTEEQGGRLSIEEWRGVFGDLKIRIRTAEGEVEYELPHPRDFRILPGAVEEGTLTTLSGVPLLHDLDVGERVPPFRVELSVVRPGDAIFVSRGDDSRVYLGSRKEHLQLHEAREKGRYPIIVLLGIMAFASFFAARRVYHYQEPDEA
ncbi:MAG: hypothetical protein GX614_10995 [Sandaracinaceae bacterium]|nr:hypothetical protein [Sandaracinaceae bacterium]